MSATVICIDPTGSVLGEDHQVTLALLGARAGAEGEAHMWDDAIRDDLVLYQMAVRKQGPGALFAIAFLTDTATWQSVRPVRL